MKIGVALRLIPDLGDEIAFDDSHTGLDLDATDLKLNEFDDYALEEAILLAEATGAEVIAMAAAFDGADRMLRTALARGAHRAVRIEIDSDSTSLSARALAPAFAEAAKALGVDLLMTGVQSADDLHGPLTGYLGAELDWPFAGAIAGVRVEENKAIARQEYSGGRASDLSLAFPAVLGIQAPSRPMRYVSGSRMREMMKAPLETLRATAPAVPVIGVVALAEPRSQSRAQMFDGDATAIARSILGVLADRGHIQA